MAGLLDRGALARLLAEEVSGALGVSRASVLLADGHDLAAAGGAELRLPVLHAAVRWVASGGEAVRVDGDLHELIAQGRTDLGWTAVWAPLMRGADLHGVWLLGERAGGRAYAPQDLRWLTTLARQAAVVLETIRYAEQEQQQAHEMQALYRQAVAARETERERLSRELHDGVLQDLCAVARDLKALESAARAPRLRPGSHLKGWLPVPTSRCRRCGPSATICARRCSPPIRRWRSSRWSSGWTRNRRRLSTLRSRRKSCACRKRRRWPSTASPRRRCTTPSITPTPPRLPCASPATPTGCG